MTARLVSWAAANKVKLLFALTTPYLNNAATDGVITGTLNPAAAEIMTECAFYLCAAGIWFAFGLGKVLERALYPPHSPTLCYPPPPRAQTASPLPTCTRPSPTSAAVRPKPAALGRPDAGALIAHQGILGLPLISSHQSSERRSQREQLLQVRVRVWQEMDGVVGGEMTAAIR